MVFKNFGKFTLGLMVFSYPQFLLADGLADLKQALSILNGNQQISGVLEVTFSEKRGEGKDLKVKTGAIKSTLSENPDGLDIRYAQDVLSKIAQENRMKLVDEEVDTPTLNGAEILSASSLIPILSSAQTITDYITQGEFKNESTIEHLGKQVRVLDFELPLESFIDDKKIREYVSKFKGSYKVLIDEQGVPIETRMTYSGKGSAYIFFSMKAKSEIVSQFQLDAGRLVRTKRAVNSSSSSTFSDRTYNGVWQLTLH